MNLDSKVAEVAGKHPVAAKTHSPARHRLPPWAIKKATEGLLNCLPKAPAAAEAATQKPVAQCQET